MITLLAAVAVSAAGGRVLDLITGGMRSTPSSIAPSPVVAERYLARPYFAAPEKSRDGDVEWHRYVSSDGRFAVEIGPITGRVAHKVLARAIFDDRADAMSFLDRMVTAVGIAPTPPITYPVEGEVDQLTIVPLGRTFAGLEAFAYSDPPHWRAVLILTLGGRAVVPLRKPE